MAYDTSKFTLKATSPVRVYEYYSTDAIGTVLGDDYFDDFVDVHSGTVGSIILFRSPYLKEQKTADYTLVASSLSSNAATAKIAGTDNLAVAATATSDGLTTGTLTDLGADFTVNVTSANAAHIVVLPAPVVGRKIKLIVGANGYELRSSAPATIGIGGGTGATAESAIPANSVAVLECISATSWVGYTITGATLAAVEAAA